jgi:hypothetical protein
MAARTLFTVLAEYKGGTYIRQVYSTSIGLAVKEWQADAMAEIANLSKTQLSHFQAAFDSDAVSVVKVDQCVNVWCLTASVDEQLLLIIIVATVEG